MDAFFRRPAWIAGSSPGVTKVMNEKKPAASPDRRRQAPTCSSVSNHLQFQSVASGSSVNHAHSLQPQHNRMIESRRDEKISMRLCYVSRHDYRGSAVKRWQLQCCSRFKQKENEARGLVFLWRTVACVQRAFSGCHHWRQIPGAGEIPLVPIDLRLQPGHRSIFSGPCDT